MLNANNSLSLQDTFYLEHEINFIVTYTKSLGRTCPYFSQHLICQDPSELFACFPYANGFIHESPYLVRESQTCRLNKSFSPLGQYLCPLGTEESYFSASHLRRTIHTVYYLSSTHKKHYTTLHHCSPNSLTFLC